MHNHRPVSTGCIEARKESKTVFIEFGENTTAHGVPRITKARTIKGKIFWVVVFLLCLAFFLYQATVLIQRYFRFETTTQIELKFEAVSFPAVTICNINPYKKSLIQNEDSLMRTLNSFDRALTDSRGSGSAGGGSRPSVTTVQRERRQVPSRTQSSSAPSRQSSYYNYIYYGYNIKNNRYLYRPVFAMCRCPSNSVECVPSYAPPSYGDIPQCICFYESNKQSAWPCYSHQFWSLTWCTNCTYSGRCNLAELPKPYTPDEDRIFQNVEPCICQNVSKHCIATLDQRFDNLWDLQKPPPETTTATTTTTEEPTTLPTTTEFVDKFEVAQSYDNVTDPAAIAVRGKINLVYAVANLSTEQKIALSYKKEDMIRMCVFNRQQCDIVDDFKIHVDPIYGNCFVFNHDARYNKTSRAGPVFGLRFMVYLDVAEYMQLTQELGARIAVHTADHYPFPDVFGYNAPAGFTSSFGIRLKKVKRLSPPYGECSSKGKAADYIYENSSYSTEGCFRTCRQRELVRRCGCGEPRFPVARGGRHCSADDPEGRACLEKAITDLGSVYKTNESCICPQPCDQSVYDITFSAAKWPSGAAHPSVLNCSGTIEECTEHLRENGAMIEVYFEQLNCEYLKESESYPWVNLLADLGGQLGLWLGFSVITLAEIFVLFWDLGKIFCCRPPPPKTYKEYNGDLFGAQDVEYTLKLKPRSQSYRFSR